jgi:hypothetical protein
MIIKMVLKRNFYVKELVIFWGGAKDVGKNNSVNGLRNVVNFIQSNNHTNIILLSVPHRFDLMKSSCVNEEISKFNRKLGKLVKHLKNVSFVKLADNRELFTQHGLHLNSPGKDILSKQLASQIAMILQKEVIPINLGWKCEHLENTHAVNTHAVNNVLIDSILISVIESDMVTVPNSEIIKHTEDTLSTVPISIRSSSRVRKVPTTGNNDFLWYRYLMIKLRN